MVGRCDIVRCLAIWALPREHDNRMHMIRHHDEGIHADAGVELREIPENVLHHQPGLVQPHRTVDDLAEQALPILGADRDEVRPLLRVVVVP
jgi:hypothetical protein